MKNIIIVFDVETSGLWNKGKCADEQPYILQLSYVLYDICNKNLIKKVNTYVQVNDSVVFDDSAISINGCTPEKCSNGLPMHSVLAGFYYDFHLAEYAIAHNLNFDSRMIQIEFQRNWYVLEKICPHGLQLFDPIYTSYEGIKMVCTMKETTQLVKAPYKNQKQEYRKTNNNFKWPTLLELHKHLFGEEPIGLHDAFIDVMVTLRSYLHYKYKHIITKEEIQQMMVNDL